MRFIKRALFVVGAMMITSSSATALDITMSLVNAGTTCDLNDMSFGCFLELDLTIRNPALDGIVGLGFSIIVKDFGGNIIDFGDVFSIFSFSNTAVPVLFGFSNFVGLTNSAPFVSNDANSGKDVLRIFNGAVASPLSPASGDGLFETPAGGNGGQNGIILQLTGLPQGLGGFVLDIDTAFGDGVLPSTVPLNLNGTIVFGIPEPSTATLLGLGLAGLAAAGRRR